MDGRQEGREGEKDKRGGGVREEELSLMEEESQERTETETKMERTR